MAMSEVAKAREQERTNGARADKEAFDGLRYAVETLLKEKKPLSPALKTGRDENFAERGPKPAERRGRPKEPIKRGVIILVVDNLVTMGMNPYRNDASSEKVSACDAVAEAWVELGAQPRSYVSLKKDLHASRQTAHPRRAVRKTALGA